MRTREIKALNAEYLSTLLKQMQEPEIDAERFDRLAKLYADVRSGKTSKATVKPVPIVKHVKPERLPCGHMQGEVSEPCDTAQIQMFEEAKRLGQPTTSQS